MARKKAADRDLDMLTEIGKNISSWYAYNSDNLENMITDKNFTLLSQWDSADIGEFARLSKPMLTFNKIYDYVCKLMGEQAANKPNLRVQALQDDAKQEVMDILEGLIKQIAFNSRSGLAYDAALENMLIGGFGSIHVRHDYTSDRSMVQEPTIIACYAPERDFYDPNAKELTRWDGDFCGSYTQMSRTKFEDEYPEIPYPTSFPTLGPSITNFVWGNSNSITIVEYFKKEYFPMTIHQLSDGQVVTDKKYKEMMEEGGSPDSPNAPQNTPNVPNGASQPQQQQPQMGGQLQQPEGQQAAGAPQMPQQMPQQNDMQMQQMFAPPVPTIVSSRKTTDYKIIRYKCIANKIIDKSDFAGKQLPNIFIPCRSHYVQGKEKTISFVRYAKDAQRFLNYLGSEIAQAVKNGRREQFMVTAENIAGVEGIWRNPSNQQGALPYKPDPITGSPPIQLHASEVPVTLLQQYQRAEGDIMSILGFYEANRGMDGQELSGVAIQQRKLSGNLSAAKIFDNLNIGITQVGRCIMSMVPELYDTERNVTIVDKNNKQSKVVINRELPGGIIENNLKEGDYDVVLDAGPSFAVQREYAMDLLMNLSKLDGVFPYIADLIADNIDIENSPRLKERFKYLVPPNVLAAEEGRPPPPPPPPDPMVQLQQQKLQLEAQQMQMKQQSAQMDMQAKMQANQLEAAKIQVQMEQLQSEQMVEKFRAGAEIGKAQLAREADTANAMAKIATAHASMQKAHHGTLQGLLKSHSAMRK